MHAMNIPSSPKVNIPSSPKALNVPFGSPIRPSSLDAIEQRAADLALADEVARWEIKSSEIVLDRRIGKGSFGEVWSGKLRGIDVAIKRLYASDLDKESLDAFRNEVAIMSKLRHPNVLLFMGACTDPGSLLIVTELLRGSVEQLIRDAKNPVSLKQRLEWGLGAAKGMSWLHLSTPVFIHRDLKTGNLLVDKHNVVKVCDFGLSHIKHNPSNQKGSYGPIGTPLWMAPEVLLAKDYNESSDLYSFGIVLWELLTQQDPFKDIDNYEEMKRAVCTENRRPQIPDSCPPSLRELISACWHPQPDCRPSFPDIIPRLQRAIVEAVISDVNGQKFWQKYLLAEDSVAWDRFCKSFCVFFSVPLSQLLTARFKCLEMLLKDERGVITMERFAKILQWFGPLEQAPDFLSRVESLLRQPYFHGFVDTAAAEKLLKTQPDGTFLVRFSSNEVGSYAISARSSDGKVRHYKIHHRPGGKFVIGKTEVDSVQEIVSRYGSKELGCDWPCAGSPFEPFFVQDKNQLANASGYVTCDFE